jgi:endonuclease YncB( thermonuclease family)
MKARKLDPTIQILLCVALIGVFAAFISRLPKPQAFQEAAAIEVTKGSFQARVINVSDGDTITVRSGNQNIKIRLA